MKCTRMLAMGVFLWLAGGNGAFAQTYIWSGIGPTGWQGGGSPTAGSTLVFGDVINTDAINLAGSPTLDSLQFSDDQDFTFVTSPASTISLSNGITSTSTSFNNIRFDANTTLSLTQAQTWSSGYSRLIVSGQITGTGPLTLAGASGSTSILILNNPSLGNTYTGGTVFDTGVGGVQVAFWNSTPFGSGPITQINPTNGVFLTAHNTLTLANDISFGSLLSLRSWDAPFTLGGSITMSASSQIRANYAFTALPGPTNEGSYPMPGPLTRNPIVITGNIGEASAGLGLSVNGSGILILKPTSGFNTYTGTTTVNGSLIFGNANAVASAAAGSVQVGTANTSLVAGYAGTANIIAPGDFATFLTKIGTASSGSVGVDTLPGQSTVTMGDAINLTGFTTTAVNGIRLGTATSAILTGTITPQGTNYHFGNGGGSLYVDSNLVGSGTQVISDNSTNGPQIPLKLYLRGTNTYDGGTVSNNGFIIFDGPSALPATGSLTAGGSVSQTGNSYIGYTENAGIASSATFLSRFDLANTWGIVGFDSAGSTVTINGVDLTGFNNGVLLGTASSAILTGILTPTSDNVLRLTAGNAGTLTVASDLTGTMALEIGTTFSTSGFSDGTVLLAPATGNSYSGGTTINTNNGITLALGTSNALGTGTLSITPSAGITSMVGLQSNGPNLIFPNNIDFQSPDLITFTDGPAQLNLTGANDFSLSGNITSATPIDDQSGVGSIVLNNATPITAYLRGNNSGYHGSIDVINGTLKFTNNNAAGTGTLGIGSSAATVEFTGTATAPILYGLSGESGSLWVSNGTTLTIDTSNQLNEAEFGGIISESGGAPTTASLIVTETLLPANESNGLYLYGDNNYSGGTTIINDGLLALGHNNAAGTGPVVVNTSTDGGLILNAGVTFTNSLTFAGGNLAGFGTFAPSNLSSITFGTGQIVVPGIPGISPNPVGTLAFSLNTDFADGGGMLWSLQDQTRTDGYSLLAISGTLNISATLGGYTIELGTFDSLGDIGLAAGFNPAVPFAFTIVSTTGGITGFSPSAFTIDATYFQNGSFTDPGWFNLSLDVTGNNLQLNFTAVPEPSTYALMLSGLAFGLLHYRRRKILSRLS